MHLHNYMYSHTRNVYTGIHTYIHIADTFYDLVKIYHFADKTFAACQSEINVGWVLLRIIIPAQILAGKLSRKVLYGIL